MKKRPMWKIFAVSAAAAAAFAGLVLVAAGAAGRLLPQLPGAQRTQCRAAYKHLRRGGVDHAEC